MINGRVVDPNSVQSQFSALTRDRDSYRHAADAADRDRRREEEALRNLRSKQSSLTEKLRLAHATLGTETKKRQLLRDEEARLRKVLAEDRSAIEELTVGLEKLDSEERARKAVFVREMDALNDELESALRQYEERRWMKILTVQSAEVLIESLSASAASGSMVCSDGRGLMDSLKEPLELLKEATDKYNHEAKTKQDLEEKVRALRAKALREPSDEGEPLGEMELDELERLWEQAWENEEENNIRVSTETTEDPMDESQQTTDDGYPAAKQHPVNMNLFYGNGHDHHGEHEDHHAGMEFAAETRENLGESNGQDGTMHDDSVVDGHDVMMQ